MYDRSVMQETVITQWNLVCANRYRQGDMYLSFLFGAFFGCFIGGITSDRFGRKPTLIAYAVLSSVLSLILPYSTSFLLFLLLRFLATVCIEAGYLTTYIVGIEIIGIKERSVGEEWKGGHANVIKTSKTFLREGLSCILVVRSFPLCGSYV
ncbi:unnamed protein product [Soboliphyme baturini]|uniref:MFS domain-containing protein n=1 Tax=Soboliphyme baturini TaxID=241478 RepID=A0A183J8D0_9BILA|nr:unnamed protein product [Soboliphyme baturini]